MCALEFFATFENRPDAKDVFHLLDIGRAVSVKGSESEPFAATVAEISPTRIRLRLVSSVSIFPFRNGDLVLVKHWDDSSVAHYWQADIVTIEGPGNKSRTLSMLGVGVSVQQRKSYRVSSVIPFSFPIIDAADAQLDGQKVSGARTQNISVGGLLFESQLLLTVGDKLELCLQHSSKAVNAVGWVVRSEAAQSAVLNSVAVEFLHIDDEDQFRLLEIMMESGKPA